MIERAVNAVWVLLGAATVAASWNMGLIGAYGPDSGLFPFLAGGLVLAAGVGLLLDPRHHARHVDLPSGSAAIRVGGVVVGLIVMAVALPRVGFGLAGVATMLILLRAVQRTDWASSVALAVGSVVAVWVLFDRVLGMPLPRGPWGF